MQCTSDIQTLMARTKGSPQSGVQNSSVTKYPSSVSGRHMPKPVPSPSEFQPMKTMDYTRYSRAPSQVDSEAILYNVASVSGMALALVLVMTLFSNQ